MTCHGRFACPFFKHSRKAEEDNRIRNLATWFCDGRDYESCRIYIAFKQNGFYAENVDPLGEEWIPTRCPSRA